MTRHGKQQVDHPADEAVTPLSYLGLMYNAVTTVQAIAQQKPQNPVFAFRPHSLASAVKYFQTHFAAKQLFAVKTNPEPHVIHALKHLNVKSYDVASLTEVKLIHATQPDAELYFMHPVKSPEAISESYVKYGVRHFSLDTHEEYEKILAATSQARDLHLHVRLNIPGEYAEINLSKKFGLDAASAITLLKLMRPHVKGLGLCFHVGSQCSNPKAYEMAMRVAEEVMTLAQVTVDYLNVGGGFPSIYPNLTPPPLLQYFDVIHKQFQRIKGQYPHIKLLAEPGRALVAEAFSLIVRVELRKKQRLYITDGTYGSLFDAGTPKFIFPTKLLRKTAKHDTLMPFEFYGPTCDSLDYMPGPFYLPSDTQTGDYIEIGQLGAYSKSLASYFNGFRHEELPIFVSDAPLMTMYAQSKLNTQPKRRTSWTTHNV